MSDDAATRRVALALVLAGVVFNLVALAPELGPMPAYGNDLLLHYTIIAELETAARTAGASAWDPWIPHLGGGYPPLHHYQPLGYHLPVWLARATAGGAVTSARWLLYLAVALLPLTFYAGARWLELRPLEAATAGLLASAMSSGRGLPLPLFGVGHASYTWGGGLGLYSQALGVAVLPLCYGALVRLLRGRARVVPVGVLLGLQVLSHLAFAYLLALVAPLALLITRRERSSARAAARLAGAGLVAFAVAAFCLVPLLLDADGMAAASKIVPPWMMDGVGHEIVVGRYLAGGHLWDGGRLPVVTLMVAIGCVIAARSRSSLAVLPLHLAALLALLCGRATLGAAIDWLPMAASMQWHRTDAMVQAIGIFLAALAVGRLAGWCWRRGTAGQGAALLVILAVVTPGLRDTHDADRASAVARAREERAHADAAAQLARLREHIARHCRGRVHAGFGWNWGGSMRVGDTTLAKTLLARDVDTVGRYVPSRTEEFYESLWLPNRDHYELFDVTCVVIDRSRGRLSETGPEVELVQPFWRLVAQAGRFRLYRIETAGAFSVVQAPVAVVGRGRELSRATFAWLFSSAVGRGVHLAQHRAAPAARYPAVVAAGDALPPDALGGDGGSGAVLDSGSSTSGYRARVVAEREAHVLLRVTWHPRWRATIDGAPAAVVELSPSFLGVRVPPGEHEVVLTWSPGPTKPLLFGLGWSLALLAWVATSLRARRQRQDDVGDLGDVATDDEEQPLGVDQDAVVVPQDGEVGGHDRNIV